jgi:phosphohistidine phosphatase
MKTLLILRHAKSSWDDPGLPDHDRPLARRGLKDAPRIGELLVEEDLVPELILASTAVRTLQTATIVAQAIRFDRELRTVPEMYLAEAAVYLALARGVDDRLARVLFVGHNPGVEDLVHVLTGRQERMPTAALALVRFPVDRWAEVGVAGPGELVRVFRPKEM